MSEAQIDSQLMTYPRDHQHGEELHWLHTLPSEDSGVHHALSAGECSPEHGYQFVSLSSVYQFGPSMTFYVRQ